MSADALGRGSSRRVQKDKSLEKAESDLRQLQAAEITQNRQRNLWKSLEKKGQDLQKLGEKIGGLGDEKLREFRLFCEGCRFIAATYRNGLRRNVGGVPARPSHEDRKLSRVAVEEDVSCLRKHWKSRQGREPGLAAVGGVRWLSFAG